MEGTMNQQFDFHHIQRSIILSLVTHSSLKFTELQPPRVANNVFSYHLKKLVDSGYVEHTDVGYRATRKALKMIAVNADQKKRVSTPAVITILYVTNNEGETLLMNRNTYPFQGWYGLPSGTVHLGESVDEAATRELFEKTGIDVSEVLDSIGILDFQYREEGTDDLFVHALAFLYKYHYTGDKSLINDKSTKFGQLSWSKFGRQHILPEVLVVREIANTGGFVKRSVRFIEPGHAPILALV